MRIHTLFSNSLPIWLVATTAFLVGGLLLTPTPVEARKKGLYLGQGCYEGDYETPGGKRCSAKHVKARGTGYGYVLYCTSGGKQCCKVNSNGSLVPGGCSPARTPMTGSDRPNTDGVLEPGPKQRPRRASEGVSGGGLREPGPRSSPQVRPPTGAPASGGVKLPPRGGQFR
jgi:hypothetical protein